MYEVSIDFEAQYCECDHEPGRHDDGFGCTESGCLCSAGWQFVEIAD